MKCTFCKHGSTKPSLINFSADKGNKIIVFKNIKADVCDTCGEQYIDSATLKLIEQKMKKSVSIQSELEVMNMAL